MVDKGSSVQVVKRLTLRLAFLQLKMDLHTLQPSRMRWTNFVSGHRAWTVGMLRTQAGILLPTKRLPLVLPYRSKTPLTKFEYETRSLGVISPSRSSRSIPREGNLCCSIN